MSISPHNDPGQPKSLRALGASVTHVITKFNTDSARAYLDWYRANHPEASPQEVLDALEKRFWILSSTAGGSVGAIAAIPVVGTLTAIGLSTVESVGFLEASIFYIIARAELHGLPTDDLMRRQTLVMTILLGGSGQATLTKAVGRTSNHWAKEVLTRIPAQSLRAVNSVLGHNMITKYGTKQGIIVLGRVIPFGIGAALGGTFGALSARAVMSATDKAFGPLPEDFPPAVADSTPSNNPSPAGSNSRTLPEAL